MLDSPRPMPGRWVILHIVTMGWGLAPTPPFCHHNTHYNLNNITLAHIHKSYGGCVGVGAIPKALACWWGRGFKTCGLQNYFFNFPHVWWLSAMWIPMPGPRGTTTFAQKLTSVTLPLVQVCTICPVTCHHLSLPHQNHEVSLVMSS